MESADTGQIRRCLRTGTNPDSLLLLAAARCLDPEVIATICEAGGNIHHVDANDGTVLQKACRNDGPRIFGTLLRLGASVNRGE